MQLSWQHAGPGPRTLGILLLAIAAWSGAVVRGGFAYDDREAIEGNPVVEGTVPWLTAFEQDYWHHRGDAGQWRPLAVLSLRLDRALWGDRTAGFHATNVLLHLLVIALAAALVNTVIAGELRGVAWFGLAVFALHPVLSDSVAWISGRTSMIAAIGGLLGALGVASIARHEPGPRDHPAAAVGVIAAVGVFAALAGKEDGILFAPLMVLLALRRSKRAAAASAVGCGVAVLVWMGFRHAALGAWLPAANHAVLGGEPLAARLLVSGNALVEALRIVLLPLDYSPSYRPADILAHVGTGAAAIALAALGWALLAALILGGAAALLGPGSRIVGAASLLAGAALLPHAQLVPSGEVFAPRFLYLPLLFGIPLVGTLFARVFRRGDHRFAVAALLVACSIPMAWDRAGVYASRAAFWTAVLAQHEDDPRAWNALGNARMEDGDLARARDAYEMSLALDPRYSRPWTNLGGIQLEEQDFVGAERSFRRAVAVGPSNPIAHGNLGHFLARTGRPAEALAEYERALTLAPGLAFAWRGLGRVRRRLGDETGAVHAFDRALALDPGDAVAARLRALGQ
ncbi:MAG: tetratricopeptide repeat protein [Planctomycetota bacterium]|nr:MAG: tetratricopeptide repeat protein [Planctomycetota bacterium]